MEKIIDATQPGDLITLYGDEHQVAVATACRYAQLKAPGRVMDPAQAVVTYVSTCINKAHDLIGRWCGYHGVDWLNILLTDVIPCVQTDAGACVKDARLPTFPPATSLVLVELEEESYPALAPVKALAYRYPTMLLFPHLPGVNTYYWDLYSDVYLRIGESMYARGDRRVPLGELE